MKKILICILSLLIFSSQQSNAQTCRTGEIPPLLETKNGITYWGGYPITNVVDESEFIFEGRVLSDSVFMLYSIGDVCTSHKVLVLKEFKGQFKSDTMIVTNHGGRLIVGDHWEGEIGSFAQKGDEALFFLTTSINSRLKINTPDFYWFTYGDGCGFVKVCDKKDVTKEVYEPLEKGIGHSYVEVHRNTCATQQKQKK